MTIERIYVADVDLADMDESVRVAAARMNTRNVGSLVVVNEQHLPIGIVTDRDLTIKVLAQGRDPYRTSVEDVMTILPETLIQGTSVADALAIMRKGPFRRLPVVDKEGKLVGLLAMDDILRLLAQQLGDISGLVCSESPQWLAPQTPELIS